MNKMDIQCPFETFEYLVCVQMPFAFNLACRKTSKVLRPIKVYKHALTLETFVEINK